MLVCQCKSYLIELCAQTSALGKQVDWCDWHLQTVIITHTILLCIFAKMYYFNALVIFLFGFTFAFSGFFFFNNSRSLHIECHLNRFFNSTSFWSLESGFVLVLLNSLLKCCDNPFLCNTSFGGAGVFCNWFRRLVIIGDCLF